MAAFTVILPHKRNKGNDRALKICLECLFDNTHHDFKLIIDAAENQPLYERINAMMEQATTDAVVYMASDVFQSPNWDVPMLAAFDQDTIVNGVVVEPGAIGLHHWNLHADFGRTPEQFKRDKFEEWVGSAHYPDGEGWFCPYMISRSRFLERGGFTTGYMVDGQGFSNADEKFFAEWKADGKRVIRTRSYAYHLQRYSDEGEQNAEKRHITS